MTGVQTCALPICIDDAIDLGKVALDSAQRGLDRVEIEDVLSHPQEPPYVPTGGFDRGAVSVPHARQDAISLLDGGLRQREVAKFLRVALALGEAPARETHHSCTERSIVILTI